MNKHGVVKVVLAASLLCLAPITGWAGGNNGRQQGPPPEAITACEGKQAGDSIEFTGRRGETIEATCEERNGQLVAVPDNMPEGGGRR